MAPEKGRRLALAVAVLGFSAIITQTIVLRQILSIGGGNELVVGIVLANWMILTGCGSFLGKFSERYSDKIRIALVLLIPVSFLPVLTVFLLSYLRNLVFPVGSMIGIIETLFGSFILLLPYCLLSGSLFTILAMIVSEQKGENRIADVYSLEALGSFIGGLVFNLVLIFLFPVFQTLLILALVDLGVCLLLSQEYLIRSFQILIVSLAAVLLLVVTRVDLDVAAKHALFPKQELLFFKDTPYGDLTITRLGDQKNFFENNSLLFVTNDVVGNEDAIHYAMVQHPNPQKVLLISGGISGTTNEILKYGVAAIHYVELNPSVIDIGRSYTSALNDYRITVFNEDARQFVRNASDRYDVVIINVPDPSTAQLNRYYTVEFFEQIRRIASSKAVVALSLLPSEDYSGPEAREVSSVVFSTLHTQFKNVLIIPGLRNHYLASDCSLTTEIASSLAGRGIKNEYVNSDYVDDHLLGQRSKTIMQTLDSTASINSDFTPVAYYRQFLYWLSYFGFKPWIPAVLAAFVFVLAFGSLNAIKFGMFTGGFSASSIEVVLIISFQILYGYVYQATGVIICGFMAGIAFGSYAGRKFTNRIGPEHFAGIQTAIGVYSFSLPFVFNLLRVLTYSEYIVYPVFIVLTVFIGALVGIEFSLATRLLRGKVSGIASSLYGVDLLGSAIGALLLSIYLIPLMGIVQSCIVIGSLSFVAATMTIASRKQIPAFVRGGQSNV